jgi:uncharacterized metal-binding protein YceD (DUF177 family)
MDELTAPSAPSASPQSDRLINITALLKANHGKSVPLSVLYTFDDVAAEDDDTLALCALAAHVQGDLRLASTSLGFTLSGQLQGTAHAPCQHCETQLPTVLNCPVHEAFVLAQPSISHQLAHSKRGHGLQEALEAPPPKNKPLSEADCYEVVETPEAFDLKALVGQLTGLALPLSLPCPHVQAACQQEAEALAADGSLPATLLAQHIAQCPHHA